MFGNVCEFAVLGADSTVAACDGDVDSKSGLRAVCCGPIFTLADGLRGVADVIRFLNATRSSYRI